MSSRITIKERITQIREEVTIGRVAGVLAVTGLAVVGLIGFDQLSKADAGLQAALAQMAGREGNSETNYNALATTVAKNDSASNTRDTSLGSTIENNNNITNTITTLAAQKSPTPTSTPTEKPTATPTVTVTKESTATPTPDKMSEWINFWPKTSADAAAMFGGKASDWKQNPDWTGDKVDLDANQFGVNGYKPREWKPVDPKNLPYNWPKTPAEAAKYFFDGKVRAEDMRMNKFGGWQLTEDHWRPGYGGDGIADKSLILHRGEVAEGYTVGPDGIERSNDDRAWVAFGGTAAGDTISVKGQGMTIWMPGTDPNKIALEWSRYNIPYYTNVNGEKLGPNAINFAPIYNAPTGPMSQIFDNGKTVTFVKSPKEILKQSLPLAGGTSPQTVLRAQDHGPGTVAFQKNPFKGNRNIYRA